MKVRAYIGLGSNQGPRRETIDKALAMLESLAGVEELQVSSVIQTEPVGGPPGQRQFRNAVASFDCSLDAYKLLRHLQTIEKKLGRVRSKQTPSGRARQWGPRTIDLDLLLFGDRLIQSSYLHVPHPRMHERLFVMTGMAELAPELVHPELGLSMRTIYRKLLQQESQIKTPPRLICVAGLIGVGKTTLAGNLAALLGGRLVLEEYKENPFLTRQIHGDDEAALPSELFFLLSRAKQLDRDQLSGGLYVSDYFFEKNRLFAELFLSADQQTIFDQLEKQVRTHILQPQLVIYLQNTVETCLERIHQRGREFEQPITKEFLVRLQTGYDQLMTGRDFSVLKIDGSRLDLLNDSTLQELALKVRNQIEENPEPEPLAVSAERTNP